jgi:signal transduction histidine kinase
LTSIKGRGWFSYKYLRITGLQTRLEYDVTHPIRPGYKKLTIVKKQTIRAPFMLEIATYVGTATMALLGVSGLPTLRLQLAILGLCLLFGILFRLHLKRIVFQKNINFYFGAQIFILALVGLLGSNSLDAFNFLFLLLTIHTALVLPRKQAAIWIIIYYVIVIGIMFLTQSINGWYAILFYLVTYIVCGFFGHAMRQVELERDRNQQLVEELQVTQKKLKELAVLDERNRLARDLHDSVKQQVFAISMQLSAARTSLKETDKAYSSIIQAEKLAQQAGTELTTLIHQLRPPQLESRSLAAALQDYAREWSMQNDIETELHLTNHVALSAEAEQMLFRVGQEALSNVARHSDATKAMITLEEEGSEIVLFIEDNGKGIDDERLQKGVGLDSMEERMSQIGGTLQVSGRKDGGTRVAARLRRA